ncbi:MAG: hypothetical protein K9H64_14850 [Bacteroidales bacterium]|nr:hypothetical protein [Bacteroidales bacterium]MCF8457244.1 hypothetical protein [Bacteroidales bacterium]
MNSASKIIVSLFNFFILLWLLFALQKFMKIGIDIAYLNIIISAFISAILVFFLWKQDVNFKTVLKYSAISWVVGLALGIAFISIYDPGDAQGIFLAILWTAPIGWIIGSTWSILKQNLQGAKNN